MLTFCLLPTHTNTLHAINTRVQASASAIAQARAYVAATPKSTKRSKRQQKSEIETDMEHERIMRGMSTAEEFEFLRDKQQEKQRGQPQQQQQQQQPITPHHIKASAVNAGFLTSGNGSHLPMVNESGEHQTPHQQQQQVHNNGMFGQYSQQQHLQQQQQSAGVSGVLYGLPSPDDPMDTSPIHDNGVDEEQHIADSNVSNMYIPYT
jgi:hypothetical protein